MSRVRFLMPPRARLVGHGLPVELGKALARADAVVFSPLLLAGEGMGERARRGDGAGEVAPHPNPSPVGRGAESEVRSWRAPLLRAFDILPRGLPVAALTRALDAPSDADGLWLRADPAHVRADMATGRLLAWSELSLTPDEAQALIAPLRPLFGDEGFLLDAPSPARWYLRLPERAELPGFADPQNALGDDLRDHLPQGAAARRWTRLLSEAQILLHNHPLNLERQRRGLPAVNSLWFWGAGARPHQVATPFAQVETQDVLLRALALAAGAALPATGSRWSADPDAGARLIDLRELRESKSLHAHWLLPALSELRRGALACIELDFPDAAGLRLARGQRWRVWRRAWSVWA